ARTASTAEEADVPTLQLKIARRPALGRIPVQLRDLRFKSCFRPPRPVASFDHLFAQVRLPEESIVINGHQCANTAQLAIAKQRKRIDLKQCQVPLHEKLQQVR